MASSEASSTPETDIKEALFMVAEQAKETGMWKLQMLVFKELDIWKYRYNSEEDRMKAKKNAEYHYDKLRLSYEGPEWSRLKEPRRDASNSLSARPVRVTSGSMSLPNKHVSNKLISVYQDVSLFIKPSRTRKYANYKYKDIWSISSARMQISRPR